MLQGYRTILVNLIALLAAWLNQKYQIVIDQNAQLAIATTALTIGNIGLRLLTKTPAFTKEAKVDQGNKVPNTQNQPK